MKQPNNLRNRWRRYRLARRAYRFTFLPFREWARGASADSYSAPKFPESFLALLRGRE